MEEPQDDLSSSCWICFGSATQEPLQRPCKCPTLVHAKCLARWQLHCAGKLEEKTCRFCSGSYPDWRPVLTPDALKAQQPVPVLSIYYGGQCTRIKVRPGPEGLTAFSTQLRKILGRDISTVNLVFRCRDPETGSELYLHGIQAWSAAIHCACVRAARRMATNAAAVQQGAQQQQRQSAGAEQRSSNAARMAPATRALRPVWHGPAAPARQMHGAARSLATVSAPASFPAPDAAYWNSMPGYDTTSLVPPPSPAQPAAGASRASRISTHMAQAETRQEPMTVALRGAAAGSPGRSNDHSSNARISRSSQPLLLPDAPSDTPSISTLTSDVSGSGHCSVGVLSGSSAGLQCPNVAGATGSAHATAAAVAALRRRCAPGGDAIQVVDPGSESSPINSDTFDGPLVSMVPAHLATAAQQQQQPATLQPQHTCTSRQGSTKARKSGSTDSGPQSHAGAIMQHLRTMIRSLMP